MIGNITSAKKEQIEVIIITSLILNRRFLSFFKNIKKREIRDKIRGVNKRSWKYEVQIVKVTIPKKTSVLEIT